MNKPVIPTMQGPARLKILSGNTEVSVACVVSAKVEEEFGRISSAEIVLDDGGFEDKDFAMGNADELLIGKTIEISTGTGNDMKLLFRGIVLRQKVLINDSVNQLVITAKHEAVKMTRVRQNKCFTDKPDCEIVREIADEYGISAQIDSTNIVHESMMQYNATDWDFINMRIEANGLVMYCGADGLVAKAPGVNAPPSLEIDNGFNLINLDAEMDASLAFDTYTARTWNYKSQEVEEEELKGGECDADQGNFKHADASSALGSQKYTIMSDNMYTDTEFIVAQNDAKAKFDALARIMGSVSFPGYAEVHPGDTATLKCCGGRLNGNAYITGVTHEVKGAIWTTALRLGTDGIPFAERFSNISTMPANGLLPSVNGLQVGLVEQLKDDPQGEERILVRLHNGEDITLWARLAMPHAGKNRGVTFIPEIGDEVIVGFVNDNPNLAIVLGSLHSSSKSSPVEINDDNNIKGIYTRENIKIEFDDDKKVVTIATPGGNTMTLSDDAKRIALEDQNGNKITMDDNGITIKSTKAINIEASQDLSQKGANVTLEAQQGFKATGNTGVEMSTSASAVLKGSIVQIN